MATTGLPSKRLCPLYMIPDFMSRIPFLFLVNVGLVYSIGRAAASILQVYIVKNTSRYATPGAPVCAPASRPAGRYVCAPASQYIFIDVCAPASRSVVIMSAPCALRPARSPAGTGWAPNAAQKKGPLGGLGSIPSIRLDGVT